jgi:DNA processing protein
VCKIIYFSRKMHQTDLKYKIALTLIPGVGDVLAKNLVSYCGSAEAIFKEKKALLLKIPEIGPVTAESIIKHKVFDRAEEEIDFIDKYTIQPLFYLDKNYPNRLKQCADAPVMLYYKGNADLNSTKIISIVGTRNATDYGKEFTEKLVADLVKHDVLIVSGLAYGIDICAHKACVKNSVPTVGVLAHGLDRLYPALHKSTAKHMVDNGGLLTEFMSNTNPDRENFPKRNRIVAGIADALVVVESKAQGGSLITADIANSYNRDVFAVPGGVNDIYSEGCNKLIKSNKAALIESALDIEYILNWVKKEEGKKKAQTQKQLFIELSADEQLLVNLIDKHDSIAIDMICANVNLPVSKIASALLNLEFSGMVKTLPGKMYRMA